MAAGFRVTFDCASVDRMAKFWAVGLDCIEQSPPEGHDSRETWARAMGISESEWDKSSALIDLDGDGPRLFFQKVPEGKAAKNRLHVDVNASLGTPPEQCHEVMQGRVQELVDAGAEREETFDDQSGYRVVMSDVESRATSSACSDGSQPPKRRWRADRGPQRPTAE